LFYPGRRHLLSGEPESLKSWLAAIAAVEQTAGDRSVVWIDFEMGAGMVAERMRALGLSGPGFERFFYLEPDEPIGSGTNAEDVTELVASAEPSLVVVDSFTPALGLHGLDPNVGVDIEKFNLAVMRPLQSTGAASVVIDHPPKNKDNRGKYSIGSERKTGAVDVHLGVEIVRAFGRGGSGLAHIRVHKDRIGWLPKPRAADLELVSDPNTGAVNWTVKAPDEATTEGDWRPTWYMEEVRTFLAGQRGAISRNQVCQGIGRKRERVLEAIRCLIADGEVVETTDGIVLASGSPELVPEVVPLV
jgi:hypothetical protein